MRNDVKAWYPTIRKPRWTPPNWLFGPVWSALYAMMGTGFALIWHRAVPGPAKKSALTWFVIQLVLNLAWTPVFFGAHQMLAALVIIVSLLADLTMGPPPHES